jgi:deoxyribonuclease-4
LAVTLRIETMGKRSQFGSLDEVLALCRDVDGLQPCLDFSHLYAREGKVNAYLDFERVLSKVARKLGPRSLRNVHIHIAGIHFGDRGEIKHLNLEETAFRTDEWLQVLRDLGVEGMVICESPNLEGDAVMLKKLYAAQAAR